MDYLAAAFFALLGGARLGAFARSGDWLSLLLAAQASLVAILMVVRRREATPAPWGQRLVAWGSAFLPMVGLSAVEGAGQIPTVVPVVISALGLVLSLWAMIALQKSFGIAPSDRGLRTGGPYRLLRHPMYAGELLNFVGFLLAHLSVWNGLVVGLTGLIFVARIIWEERGIHGYGEYAQHTHWRLIYGVW